jgi:hypothetical protein
VFQDITGVETSSILARNAKNLQESSVQVLLNFLMLIKDFIEIAKMKCFLVILQIHVFLQGQKSTLHVLILMVVFYVGLVELDTIEMNWNANHVLQIGARV